MRKGIVFLLILSLVLALSACNQVEEYSVTVDYPYLVEELKPSYPAGEEVTLKLATVTESSYKVYVDDEEIPFEKVNMKYTYFTFTMPDRDVTVRIEEFSVDIPA